MFLLAHVASMRRGNPPGMLCLIFVVQAMQELAVIRPAAPEGNVDDSALENSKNPKAYVKCIPRFSVAVLS